ncbi:primase associated factor [Elephant endotheliotropic herpesvirus 3B]|nr:primase associated factor [Elephant endotheliotropic herpesvirus 3B]
MDDDAIYMERPGKLKAHRGVCCNVTLYNLIEMHRGPRPLFQVTFLITDQATMSSKIDTFYIVGEEVNRTMCQTMRCDDTSDHQVHLKRIAVTTMMYSNQLVRAMMRLFHPTEVVVNESGEIVFATAILGAGGGEYDMLHMRSMGKLAAIGNYVEPCRPSTPPGMCRGTWKVRHGLRADRESLMISLTVENQKYIFSDACHGDGSGASSSSPSQSQSSGSGWSPGSGGGSGSSGGGGGSAAKRPRMDPPFIMEPYRIRGTPIVKIVPRTILLWFQDTQCTVLLRDGMTLLYEKLMRDFGDQVLPMCRYLGPDIVTGGGDKEICFIGFPFLSTACLKTEESGSPCNVCFIDSIRCHGGLSPAYGNVQVCYAIRKYGSLTVGDEYSQMFNLYLSEDGLKVNQSTICDDMLMRLPEDVRYAYVKYGALICVKFKHVNYGTLCRLIGENDMPLKCCHYHDKDQRLVNYVNRHINDNFTLYADFFKTRSLVFTIYKQKINEHPKCTWLVSDNCTKMFVATARDDWQEVAKFLEDAFREAWVGVMQSARYVTVLTEAYVGENYVMIVKDQVLSSIGTHNAEHNWLSDVELLILNLLRDVRHNPTNCVETLKVYLRCCIVTMIQNRNTLRYWVFDVPPCKFKVVCEGTFDCTPYHGIYGKNSELLIQYLPSLSDRIDFIQYFCRAADMMKLAVNECLKIAVDMESVDVLGTEIMEDIKSEIVSRYGNLFFFN